MARVAGSGVCLIGFMGAGKSTLASALAPALELPLVDLDERVEAREGRSIPELFAERGERGFRRAEAQALHEVLSGPPVILASGGGAPCQLGAMEAMGSWGLTVFLDVPLEELARRVGQGEGRPLWGEQMGALLARRRPIYLRAEVVLDARRPVEDLVVELLGVLEER